MVPSGGRGSLALSVVVSLCCLEAEAPDSPRGYEWSAVRKELPLIRDEKLLQYKGVVVVLSSEAISRSFQYPCTDKACL